MSLRTLQRYAASGNAPRAIYLALWFESSWGLGTLHAQAVKKARHARAWVASLERECERLRGVIRAYEAGPDAAANAPAYHSISRAELRRPGAQQRTKAARGSSTIPVPRQIQAGRAAAHRGDGPHLNPSGGENCNMPGLGLRWLAPRGLHG